MVYNITAALEIIKKGKPGLAKPRKRYPRRVNDILEGNIEEIKAKNLTNSAPQPHFHPTI